MHNLRRPPESSVRLRPSRRLFWRALSSSLAFTVPVLAVLYVLTIPDGPWPLVVAVHVATTLAFGAASIAYIRTGFWVTAEGIAERGFFGSLTFVRREEIESAMLARTFHGSGTTIVPQLFLVDRGLRQLVRMRGQFWSLDEMNEVCEILGLPVTELTPPVSAKELLADYPGLMYWFERRPRLAAALIFASAGAVLAACGAALVMTDALT